MPSPSFLRRAGLDAPTLIGMSAVVMWSATVGLYRAISEIFGTLGGSALIFTVSGILAALHAGPGLWKGHRGRYLILGGALFVFYEICLALAVGFATSRSQSVEIGLINYLWPCLTIALAVAVGQARGHFVLLPGVAICLSGVLLASAGGSGFSLSGMAGNIAANPLPYVLGLGAALSWPAYTVLTRSLSGGRNGTGLFLLATAAALWAIYAASDAPPLHFDLRGAGLIAALGLLTTLAYTAWTHGVNHGSLTLMATASYFTPLLSVGLSSVLLNMSLGLSFWLGAALVTLGSLLCWWATRR